MTEAATNKAFVAQYCDVAHQKLVKFCADLIAAHTPMPYDDVLERVTGPGPSILFLAKKVSLPDSIYLSLQNLILCCGVLLETEARQADLINKITNFLDMVTPQNSSSGQFTNVFLHLVLVDDQTSNYFDGLPFARHHPCFPPPLGSFDELAEEVSTLSGWSRNVREFQFETLPTFLPVVTGNRGLPRGMG